MWKTPTTAVTLALMTSVGSAATAQQNPGATARSEDGRTLFLTYCSSCHGTSAHGDGPVAADLLTRPADLTQLATRTEGAFLAAMIQRMIDGRDRYIKAHGSIEMPVWGDAFKREGLSEEAIKARIEAIVRYLRSIQQQST